MLSGFCLARFGVLFCKVVSGCHTVSTHLKLRDRVVTVVTVVSGASFLTVGVSECDIADRLSVAVLYMLYKFRRNPMPSLYGALPVPYVPVRLHMVLWSHIHIIMRLLAAVPRRPHDIYSILSFPVEPS